MSRMGWLLAGCCALVGVAQAAPPPGCAGLQAEAATLEIAQGMQQELRLPVPIKRLAVGDPAVADVNLTSRDAFLLVGRQGGVTNLSIWTDCSSVPRQSMVFVRGAAVQALANPPQLQRYESLPSQVQADVRFVEVSRTKVKEVGIRLFGTSSNNFLFGSPGSNTLPSVPVGGIGGVTTSTPLVESGFNILFGGGSRQFLMALNALEGSGFAYTLARPSLVALSGQTASFLAGGEVPIPVPSTGSDTISIEYKEFGVRLSLTPTVIDRGRITLKVAPEVSELDYTNGVVIQGITVPALLVRRTDTTVSLADGESFVIGGLINTRNQSVVEKLPGLGSVPVLGALFRSSSIQREDKELLMIVTPHLVQPLAADATLPELPGEALRRYDPNAFKLLFLEDGRFDRFNGLSQ
nr:type II and III secretion system protein family protein [Pseudomonas sp. ABC1]